MRLFFAVIFVIVVVGCGGSGSSPTPALSTAKEKDDFMSSCTSSAGGVSQTTMSYCDCVLNAINSRYTTDDVSKNGIYELTNELIKDGTVAKCAKDAGPAN